MSLKTAILRLWRKWQIGKKWLKPTCYCDATRCSSERRRRKRPRDEKLQRRLTRARRNFEEWTMTGAGRASARQYDQTSHAARVRCNIRPTGHPPTACRPHGWMDGWASRRTVSDLQRSGGVQRRRRYESVRLSSRSCAPGSQLSLALQLQRQHSHLPSTSWWLRRRPKHLPITTIIV